MKKHFLTVVYAIDDKPETVEAILAQRPWQAVAHTDALKDLEHAQDDLTATMDGYAAARLEIESLQSRLIHANEQHRLWFARSQELEAQLDAVGAAFLAAPRKQQMTDTKPTHYAWTVNGTAQMFFGDYAKHDAEQEAKHIGGTALAFPLFVAPKPLTDDQVYEAIKGIDSLDALQVWRAAEAAHGITQQG